MSAKTTLLLLLTLALTLANSVPSTSREKRSLEEDINQGFDKFVNVKIGLDKFTDRKAELDKLIDGNAGLDKYVVEKAGLNKFIDENAGLDKLIEGKAGIGEPCFVDNNCAGTPFVKCAANKENGIEIRLMGHGTSINGECKFTLWFILVVCAIVLVVILGICCLLRTILHCLCCGRFQGKVFTVRRSQGGHHEAAHTALL